MYSARVVYIIKHFRWLKRYAVLQRSVIVVAVVLPHHLDPPI